MLLSSGELPLFVLLIVTAVVVAELSDLFAAAMLTGIFSLIVAGLYLLMDAVDVAFTEAAVGAGIATVLMLGTLAITSRHERQQPFRILPLLIVVTTGAALVYGTFDMPRYGDPDAPIHHHVAPEYLEGTAEEIHVPNVVTAVLASYRGYDTLGETMVIFTAGIGVLLLLGGWARPRRVAVESDGRAPMRMREKIVLQVVSRILVPFILLFALYVQFHGDFGPGGGFQAGVIFAAGLILYALIFGLEALRRVAPPRILERVMAVGVLIYGGVGVVTLVLGGNFLDYDTLAHEGGQHWGIFLVELGVGIAVAGTMTTLFYRFAGYWAQVESLDRGGGASGDGR